MNTSGLDAFVQKDGQMDVSESARERLTTRREISREMVVVSKSVRDITRQYAKVMAETHSWVNLASWVRTKWEKDNRNFHKDLLASSKRLQDLIDNDKCSKEVLDAWFNFEKRGYKDGLVHEIRRHLGIGREICQSIQDCLSSQ